MTSICILVWLAIAAPAGYEDETGFHYGTPPDSTPAKSDGATDEDRDAA